MDDKIEQLGEIEDKLEKQLEELVENTKISLLDSRKKLDENAKDIINTYSNEIRNLAIISGTVAPFSLTLLEVEKISINIQLLLAGFFLLIFNIALAQFLLQKKIKRQEKKFVGAEFNWLLADSNLFEISDAKKTLSDRASKVFDLVNNTDKLNTFLGLTYIDIELTKLRIRLSKYSSITNLIFIGGTSFIAISVFLESIINYFIRLYYAI